jgi:hypothetical protein
MTRASYMDEETYGAGSAKNVDVGSVRLNGTSDTRDSQVGDWDTVGWSTSWGAVLVVLLNDNTVAGDTGESDILEDNARDGTSSIGDRLDADTVGRVGDRGGGNGDVADGVVSSATNGTNGETVTARASTTSEGDTGTRVDGKAVILVDNVGVGDGNIRRAANIESIGVVALINTGRVIVGERVNGETLGAVDGHELDWGVDKAQTSNAGGTQQLVGVEELWLRLASVGTLTIPPGSTTTIDGVTASTGNDDVSSRNGDQWTRPFFVAKGGGSGELDGSTIVQVSQVKSGTGWDGNVVKNNGSTAGLRLGGGVGVGEGASSGRRTTLGSVLQVWSGSRNGGWDGSNKGGASAEDKPEGCRVEVNHGKGV